MKQLQYINLPAFKTESGKTIKIPLSYQTFGKNIGDAPLIVINHALTGNSQVTGKEGWWQALVGDNKVIDTLQYSIIVFNVPGNGFDDFYIQDYKAFTVADVADLFLQGLQHLKVTDVALLMGGSIGGSIGWHMVQKAPDLVQHFIPIACDWKTTDWVLAQCKVQAQILANSSKPVEDARMHAMTFYRTPASLTQKFNRSKTQDGLVYQVEDWLHYHGVRLAKRFSYQSYQLLNHLLTTVDIAKTTGDFYTAVSHIQAHIHLVGIPTDGLFVFSEIESTYNALKQTNKKVSLHTIESIHGHDAFLIENEQIIHILQPIMEHIQNKITTYEYLY